MTMTSAQFIVSIVFALLGGGGIASIVLNIHQEKKRKQELQRTFLEKQLQKLYGPVYLAVSEIRDAFARADEIRNAGGKHFIGKEAASGEAQKRFDEQMEATIELANSHVFETVIPVREKLFKVVNDHSYLADPDDIEMFITFMRDCDYYRIEITKDNSKVPMSIRARLREISFSRQEFVERMEQKFQSKKKAWQKLHNL